MADCRILIRPLDPQLMARLAQVKWSGVYQCDVATGWVAVTPSRGILLGCAIHFNNPSSGPPFISFAVNPSTRHPGEVAAMLAQQLESGKICRQRNWILDPSPEYQALEAHGFQVIDSGYFYKIAMENVCEKLERIQKIMDRIRPLTQEQEVTTWQPKWRSDVRRIALAESLADAGYLDSLLTPGSPDGLSECGSTLAFDAGQLVGFFLAVNHGPYGEIPVRWVAPSHRNSWVNARMMIHSLQEGYRRNLEVKFLQFKGDESAHLETRHMCQQFGGAETARCVRLAFGV